MDSSKKPLKFFFNLLIKIFLGFLNGEVLAGYCQHLDIGSSLFYRLLTGSLDLKRVHKKNYHSNGQEKGRFFEDVFKKKFSSYEWLSGYEILLEEPRKIAKDFKWLSAKPDFILKEKKSQKKIIVEVKGVTHNSANGFI